MAVDTQKLFYLLDPVFQIENLAGKPVVGGHIEVFVAGTDTKYITWQDWGGARNPFKIPLKSDGRAVILVEPQYTYDVYVYDSFNNMVCSRLNVSPAIGGDVSVSGLTQVFHDETISGNGTPQEPIGVVSAGKVYEGIEPIIVNNTEDKISANHVPLGVQDPLYFVQDDEEGCIIGFSGQPVPEGVMTESALGFENDKITGYNGSAFSAGNEYEEGDNIDITNGVISGKDWTDEIHSAANDASAAATAWTDSQGYLTGVDLSEYAKESFVISAIDSSTSGLLPTSAFATASGSFITALPSDLATTGWVDSQGYLTSVDISESAVWNATTQTVSANSAAWAGGTANPQIPVTGINGIKISESGDKVVFEVSADYATEDWVTGQGYLTAETDWTNTITAASANAYNEATAAIPTGLATTGDLQTVSGEITALIPSTAGLATESYVTSQGYITNDAITGKQDITGMTAYATVESLTAKQDAGDYLSATDSANFLLTSDSGNFYPSDNPSAFITGVDLTPYQTTADMVNYQTTADMVNYQTTAGMTAYQSAGDYLTTADSGNFLTAIPDTYLQNTDLSTEDGKVTAISGIPLSAGGDVPEGVMVESGLEYNAVNEISAYNGSAIAQYGAEKQFIVHDDTLVHLSNSAQYALGVNVSAVQTLMGLDETVLFSGNITVSTAQNVINLNESLHNFKKIKIYDKSLSMSPLPYKITELEVDSGSKIFGTNDVWFDIGWNPTSVGSHYHGFNFYSGNADGTQWITLGSYIGNMGTSGVMNSRNDGRITKIVGVHRISG